jgi:hypothetical protein
VTACDYCQETRPGELAPGPDAEHRFVEEFHRFPTFFEWQALQKTQQGWDLAARCRDSNACLQRHRERFPDPPQDRFVARMRRREQARDTADAMLTLWHEGVLLGASMAQPPPASVQPAPEVIHMVRVVPVPGPRVPVPQEPPQASRPRRRPRPLATTQLALARASRERHRRVRERRRSR